MTGDGKRVDVSSLRSASKNASAVEETLSDAVTGISGLVHGFASVDATGIWGTSDEAFAIRSQVQDMLQNRETELRGIRSAVSEISTGLTDVADVEDETESGNENRFN